jgi:hypothetical protein
VLSLLLALLGGCTSASQHRFVDAAMSGAYRPAPPPGAPTDEPYELLAGDLHCHVSPPDGSWHVVRDLPETAALAAEEGLDFVVLTPHVWARFFADEGLRARVLGQQAALRSAVAALPPGGPLFVPGFEYTDGQYGHVGVAFADAEQVLADLPTELLARRPELFFERYVAAGGVLTINHPFTTPIPFLVSIARADLSWRPFTAPDGPFPAEIQAIGALAQTFEAYNLTTSELRDRLLRGDRDESIRLVLEQLDRDAPRQHRPMTAVGGSDSHSHHLRATTFVLSAAGRTTRGLREALVAGRTCVRDPAACSLRARAPGGPWVAVGGAIEGASSLEVWATGGPVQLYRDSALVAEPAAGLVTRVAVPPSCAVLRARVGGGYSSAIYVNCGFAAR